MLSESSDESKSHQTHFFSHKKRSFSSRTLKDESAAPKIMGSHHAWTISDAVEIERLETKRSPKMIKLPLKSFNHIAREVGCIEKSKRFYVDILGFSVAERPPFDCEGYWLFGYGLSLHIVSTTTPDYRKQLKNTRIEHFSNCLPRVDHIAFVTEDVRDIQKILDEARVYYKMDQPCRGINQLFFFDPDGNVNLI